MSSCLRKHELRLKSADLVQQLIADTVARLDVLSGQRTLHADLGSAMRPKPVVSLLVDLQVCKRHSRPYVSDNNPYSDSQFKTMKYWPDFPKRFGCIENARAHCQTFFSWYNDQHCHSDIVHMTPGSVHYGQAGAMRAVRQAALDDAFRATPNRFKGIRPCLAPMPTAVWINPSAPTPQMLSNSTLLCKFMTPGVAKSLTHSGRVDAQLQDIANDSALVKSFFRHPSVSYITDF